MIDIPEVNIDYLITCMEGKIPHLIDVREQIEWDSGHIPNAIHIPLSSLEQNPQVFMEAKCSLEDEVIVYCRSGKRSLVGASILKQLGYINVSSLSGGILAYMHHGNELVKLNN